jgi:hypothetical protein
MGELGPFVLVMGTIQTHLLEKWLGDCGFSRNNGAWMALVDSVVSPKGDRQIRPWWA